MELQNKETGTREMIDFPGGSVVKNPLVTHETGVVSLCQEDSLGKGMTTHASILTWEIPWIEKPGWLQSTGSQRVGQNLATHQ